MQKNARLNKEDNQEHNFVSKYQEYELADIEQEKWYTKKASVYNKKFKLHDGKNNRFR